MPKDDDLQSLKPVRRRVAVPLPAIDTTSDQTTIAARTTGSPQTREAGRLGKVPLDSVYLANRGAGMAGRGAWKRPQHARGKGLSEETETK
jgi:hypothetical protein